MTEDMSLNYAIEQTMEKINAIEDEIKTKSVIAEKRKQEWLKAKEEVDKLNYKRNCILSVLDSFQMAKDNMNKMHEL